MIYFIFLSFSVLKHFTGVQTEESENSVAMETQDSGTAMDIGSANSQASQGQSKHKKKKKKKKKKQTD